MSKFILPALPYEKGALAPYMSVETLEFHYGKHHQAYCNKLNELVEGTKWAGKTSPEDLVEIIKGSYKEKQAPLFNNAAQFYNHIIFWNTLKANGGGKPPKKLSDDMERSFGSFDEFLKLFKETGVAQFGSGWVWLSKDMNSKKLKVEKYANGENPLIKEERPLFGIDVWEHAYYLDYQNRRPDYIEAILKNLVNWEAVENALEHDYSFECGQK